jgi:hypothetical protein
VSGEIHVELPEPTDKAAGRRGLIRAGLLTAAVGLGAVAVGAAVGGYGFALAGLGGVWALIGALLVRRGIRLR